MLYAAVSTAERLSFHTLNRSTGNRVRRQFVDQESGEVVETDDQVKGYEVGQGEYVVLERDEVAAAVPDGDKTLLVQNFVFCDEVDEVYLDRPYYLTPSGEVAQQAFAVLREGMRKRQVVALAQTLLFRRMRTLLIRPYESGLIATTLNFDYEVRSSEEAFDDLPDLKIEGEMLELAKHIINTKKGSFDAKAFDDRYESAVAELVKAKIEGRTLPKRTAPPPAKSNDLLQALRDSAGLSSTPKPKPAAKKKAGVVASPPKAQRGSRSKRAA